MNIVPTFPNVRKHVTLKDVEANILHTFELELEQHPTWMWVEHIALKEYGLKRGKWAMTVMAIIDGKLCENHHLIRYTNALRDAGVQPVEPEGFSREQK